MEAVTPESLPYGLIAKRRATLSMTTILFGEASRLFAMSRPDTPYEELQRLVVEENALLKRTESSRRRVFRALREFYGLRQPIPVYRIARELWEEAPAEQPLVAMLCCLAREPLLRSTAAVVLPKPAGAPVRTDELDPAIEKSFPGRYRENVRARMARHAASSWQQSGHLAGKQRKTRGTALSGPATTAHALLLGHLCGVRGKQLFDTLWVRTLDCSTARGHEYREEYFQNPDDLALALDDFADHLDVKVRESAVADATPWLPSWASARCSVSGPCRGWYKGSPTLCPVGCGSSSPASGRAATTACWTRRTAGIICLLPSRRP